MQVTNLGGASRKDVFFAIVTKSIKFKLITKGCAPSSGPGKLNLLPIAISVSRPSRGRPAVHYDGGLCSVKLRARGRNASSTLRTGCYWVLFFKLFFPGQKNRGALLSMEWPRRAEPEIGVRGDINETLFLFRVFAQFGSSRRQRFSKKVCAHLILRDRVVHNALLNNVWRPVHVLQMH